MKKNYFSSHKLPKQQPTSFGSQGILGVKVGMNHVGGVKICNNSMLKEFYWE
jgi:hypothetical protein